MKSNYFPSKKGFTLYMSVIKHPVFKNLDFDFLYLKDVESPNSQYWAISLYPQLLLRFLYGSKDHSKVYYSYFISKMASEWYQKLTLYILDSVYKLHNM